MNSERMPWTTTIDAKTGATKTFFLDASFGCSRAKREETCATNSQPIFEVTWLKSRYSEERDSRKFWNRETASDFFAKKKTARTKPEWHHHISGVHAI